MARNLDWRRHPKIEILKCTQEDQKKYYFQVLKAGPSYRKNVERSATYAGAGQGQGAWSEAALPHKQGAALFTI